MTTAKNHQTKIGFLWGDFPWDKPPPQIGKLLSYGVSARNITRALRNIGTVIPYNPPEAHPSTDEYLREFLNEIDVLWGDLSPGTDAALVARSQLGLSFRALLFAAGVMPKAAEGVFFLWQQLIRSTDTLLFTSRADQQIWQRLTEQSSPREYIVPIPIDDTIFTPRPDARQRLRDRFGLSMDAPVLLYVGRINIQKNIHLLLRVLNTVQATYPTAQLWIVGAEDTVSLNEFNVPNTGYKAWLGELAIELRIEHSVHFLGTADAESLVELYSAADILVNLSAYHRENFGLAQAEAQTCGLPVVCCAWGGFKDVIRHGETGFFVDAIMSKYGIRVNWLTAAHRVIELLEHPDKHAAFSTEAIRQAQHFSISAFANHITHALTPVAAPPYEKGTPSYLPSQLAQDYETHKQAAGWYDDNDEYRGMFQGHDYALYEQLIGPYASKLAAELKPEHIALDWIPYRVVPVQTIPARRLVIGQDPIWPTHTYLDELEWAVFSLTEQRISVAEIIRQIAASNIEADSHAIVQRLCHLHLVGLIVFTDSFGERPI